jgi:hypothetical protein
VRVDGRGFERMGVWECGGRRARHVRMQACKACGRGFEHMGVWECEGRRARRVRTQACEAGGRVGGDLSVWECGGRRAGAPAGIASVSMWADVREERKRQY